MSEVTLSKDLYMAPYKKSVVVYGKTTGHEATLRRLGGIKNSKIQLDKEGCCWVFRYSDRGAILDAFKQSHHSKQAKPKTRAKESQREEKPLVEPLAVLAPELFLVKIFGRLVVYGLGQTDRYQDTLKELGGKFNPKLGLELQGCCWTFAEEKEDTVIKKFRELLPYESDQDEGEGDDDGGEGDGNGNSNGDSDEGEGDGGEGDGEGDVDEEDERRIEELFKSFEERFRALPEKKLGIVLETLKTWTLEKFKVSDETVDVLIEAVKRDFAGRDRKTIGGLLEDIKKGLKALIIELDREKKENKEKTRDIDLEDYLDSIEQQRRPAERPVREEPVGEEPAGEEPVGEEPVGGEEDDIVELAPNLFLTPYKKAVVVFGETTSKDREQLVSLGGKWNNKIKLDGKKGCCWVFKGSDREAVIREFTDPRAAAKIRQEKDRERERARAEEQHVIELDEGLMLAPYEKSLVVYGDKSYINRGTLKELGGRWNSGITLEGSPKGCCWVFRPTDRDKILRRFGKK